MPIDTCIFLFLQITNFRSYTDISSTCSLSLSFSLLPDQYLSRYDPTQLGLPRNRRDCVICDTSEGLQNPSDRNEQRQRKVIGTREKSDLEHVRARFHSLTPRHDRRRPPTSRRTRSRRATLNEFERCDKINRETRTGAIDNAVPLLSRIARSVRQNPPIPAPPQCRQLSPHSDPPEKIPDSLGNLHFTRSRIY